MIKLLVILHLIGACIWLGGHLLLAIRYLPEALRKKNPAVIRAFEEKFETIGIPALITQLFTGIILAYLYKFNWFSFATETDIIFNLKLTLMLVTVLLAIHARLFIIPKLTAANLPSLAIHIISITVIALTFVFLGISFRFGL